MCTRVPGTLKTSHCDHFGLALETHVAVSYELILPGGQCPVLTGASQTLDMAGVAGWAQVAYSESLFLQHLVTSFLFFK